MGKRHSILIFKESFFFATSLEQKGENNIPYPSLSFLHFTFFIKVSYPLATSVFPSHGFFYLKK